jgi:hypothetical protein
MHKHESWITAQNIERFSRKLENEQDPAKRRVLQELLLRERDRQRLSS